MCKKNVSLSWRNGAKPITKNGKLQKKENMNRDHDPFLTIKSFCKSSKLFKYFDYIKLNDTL